MSELAPSEVHKARSKIKGDDCEACFYCGLPMGNFHHEHDHMPRPVSAGGGNVVAACITCHDLKDRYRASNWSATWWANAIFELLTLDVLADALRQPDTVPDRGPACLGARVCCGPASRDSRTRTRTGHTRLRPAAHWPSSPTPDPGHNESASLSPALGE